MGPILGFGTLPNRLRMTENLCNHCLIPGQRRVYIKPRPKSQIEQRVSTAQNPIQSSQIFNKNFRILNANGAGAICWIFT